MLAVAALSSRLMAESASRGGFRVVALDVFGDVDTRRAASVWHRIGEPATMRLDGERFVMALETLRGEAQLVGWVAGSGFEAIPEALRRGTTIAPLIGNAPSVIERARQPAVFFSRLDALGIPHPAVSFTAPPTQDDWLVKDAGGSGAWHIAEAAEDHWKSDDMAAGRYFQRRVRGRSLSALFLANGRTHRIVGLTEQIIRERGGHPYVYCGVVGPVSLSSIVKNRIEEAIRAVVVDFELVGLNSMDFLCDDEEVHVLEVNPRPSSSMALYDNVFERGLMHAHVEASLRGALVAASEPRPPDVTRGTQIVFADRRYRIASATLGRLLESSWCHDIPLEGSLIGVGEPVCSVSADASRADLVYGALDQRCETVRTWLEVSRD